MGDGTKENPYTREDVLKLIAENGGTAICLDFSGKVFEKGIDLRGLDLRGIILKEANLPEAHLEEADLRGVHLEKAKLIEAHLEGTDLCASYLEGADLSFAHLEKALLGYAHLDGTTLLETHLEGAELWKTCLQGADLVGVILSPETVLQNTNWGNCILAREQKGYFDLAVETYRQLKVWYANAGVHDTAAKFYYREKEAGRKALKWRSKLWYHRLALEASRLVFGYGERWWNILCLMALVVFGSAATYFFGGLDPLYSLYFSVISFTALGYGGWINITPQGWMQALGAVESFIGVFMMALLLVTFVRKWTR